MTLPYDDGPAPEGYRLQSRPTAWMWAPGMAAFVSTYASCVAIGALVHGRSKTAWYIPLAGPFVAAQDSRNAEGSILPIALGAGQIAGVVLTVSGFLLHKKRFVRVAEFDVDVSPTMHGANLPGLSVHGRF